MKLDLKIYFKKKKKDKDKVTQEKHSLQSETTQACQLN